MRKTQDNLYAGLLFLLKIKNTTNKLITERMTPMVSKYLTEVVTKKKNRVNCNNIKILTRTRWEKISLIAL